MKSKGDGNQDHCEPARVPPAAARTARRHDYELDEGELIRLPPAGRTHAAIVIRIASYLDALLDPTQFTVLGGEADVILSDVEDKGIVRGADFAVERASELDESYAREPFVVAVEVVSKDQDPEDLERKKKPMSSGWNRDMAGISKGWHNPRL